MGPFLLLVLILTPIYWEADVEYETRFIKFETFYSIHSIDQKNNLHLWWVIDGIEHQLIIPTSSYKITDLLPVLT